MTSDIIEIALHTDDFDSDSLRVARLDVRERMSTLYEADVEVVDAGGAKLGLDDIEGASVNLRIVRDGATLRAFDGVVASVWEHADRQSEGRSFRLRVVPRFWFASLVETLDIHHELSIPDLLRKKLHQLGMAEPDGYRLLLQDGYAPRDMLVQYRETDLAFLQRRAEHAGIFYYFESREDGHTIVFGDHVGAYEDLPGGREVAFDASGMRRGVFELTVERHLIPAHYHCRDYNDQRPALELHEEHRLEEGFAGGIVEYGLDFRNGEEGKRFARARAEERLATRQRTIGASDDPRFAPGHVFELTDHEHHDGSLLLLEVEHHAVQQLGGHADPGEPSRYENRFVAIDAAICFRPPRTTPTPTIPGIVSGIIETGQGAIEQHAKIDGQGRYLVRFMFDTMMDGQRNASCAVRMVQALAGAGYGMHFPLRPGAEVAVAFRGGNPDRPVIVGAVPNPITGSPVTAADATKSRIKTRSGIIIEFDDSTRE